MHGLINRAIEEFARATYGDALWTAAAGAIGMEPRGFVLMRVNDAPDSGKLMRELSRRLSRGPRDLAEDIGAWVARLAPIRRLMRFAGPDFHAFVMALPELRGRVAMVVQGLYLPRIVTTATPDGWILEVDGEPVWLHALAGVLQVIADDYGVLAVVEVVQGHISIRVPVTDFSAGRPFSISDPTVGA